MQTKCTYFDDSYQYISQAKILACASDENGFYIVLDQTIFYPQGGGQPCDTGHINSHPIHAVKWVQTQIRHYTMQDPSNLLDHVNLAIDKERRIQNSQCHTAGHLLSHVVETLYPHYKAVKGHHYADGAYVEFSCQTTASPINLEQVNAEVKAAINQNLPIITTNTTPLRLVQIGHFPHQPCGGTHVQTLGELKPYVATKQKCKDTTLRISYSEK